MVTSRIADHVGRVLGGRYRLLAPIGTGASGHVFVADDITLRRRVAVKVLHPGLAGDEAFLRRFRAEAQSAAALNHPHIMRVFDWGEDADGPFLVLEHLGGGSLRDLLDTGQRLTPSQALLVGIEAARALDYAHRRGLVHRDIKPANLLFDDEGRACIADFGLARALAEAAWTEPSGAVLGSARYASPEQAKGLNLDGRADVYSLALTLVEAITGQVPFSSDTTIGTLMARTDRSLVAPPEVGPLAAAIEGAGVLDPAQRFDAAALVGALNRAATDLPAPGPLPLAGALPIDASRVVDDRDATMLGASSPSSASATSTAPRLFDAELADGTGDEDTTAAVGNRRWRHRLLWLPAILIAVALGIAAAYALTQATLPSHSVPDLAGQTVAQARVALAPLKLKVHIDSREYRDQTTAGQIINQVPSAHAKLKEKATVGVVVSRGPPLVAVPDLAGKAQADAVAALDALGLHNTVNAVSDETVPKGMIVDWGPKRMQPKGSSITLVVSTGPGPRVIDDWKGKTFDDATAALVKAGFKVKRNDIYSDDVTDVGAVVSTDPAAGAKAAYGSTITVNVSKGPVSFKMPDVRGKSVDEATQILSAAGLNVIGTFGPPNAHNVYETDPQHGADTKRGADVYLYTKR